MKASSNISETLPATLNNRHQMRQCWEFSSDWVLRGFENALSKSICIYGKLWNETKLLKKCSFRIVSQRVLPSFVSGVKVVLWWVQFNKVHKGEHSCLSNTPTPFCTLLSTNWYLYFWVCSIIELVDQSKTTSNLYQYTLAWIMCYMWVYYFECYLSPDDDLQLSPGLVVHRFVQNYVSTVG